MRGNQTSSLWCARGIARALSFCQYFIDPLQKILCFANKGLRLCCFRCGFDCRAAGQVSYLVDGQLWQSRQIGSRIVWHSALPAGVAPAVLGLGGLGIDRGLAQPFAARLFRKRRTPAGGSTAAGAPRTEREVSLPGPSVRNMGPSEGVRGMGIPRARGESLARVDRIVSYPGHTA